MTQYLKAITAAIVTGLTAVLASWEDGGDLSAQEIVVAVIAALVALGGVWAVPNRPPTNGG